MKTKIYCIKQNGKHQFFVSLNKTEYYLFSQNFRKGVERFFSKPQTYDEAVDFSKANKNFSILNTMKKIPSYIRYVEKYYGIILTNKTQKKTKKKKYINKLARGIQNGNKESCI